MKIVYVGLFFYETALKGGFQKYQYICFSLLC